MEPDHALLLLIALKGAPLSILVAMCILRRPCGRVDLVTATGYKKDVISAGVRLLIDLGLVVRVSRFENWQLTQGVRQLPLVFETLAIEAPDPARAIKSPSREGSSVVVVTQGRDMTIKRETQQQASARAIKSPSPVPQTSVQALIDLGVPRRRAEKAIAAAVARGEEELAILAKIAAGTVYCNSPAAESVQAPAQLIAARIEDGAPFTSDAFAGRSTGGSKSDRQLDAKHQSTKDYFDKWRKKADGRAREE